MLRGILAFLAERSLRNLDAGVNIARMVAVKYRGLLGYFGLLCRREWDKQHGRSKTQENTQKLKSESLDPPRFLGSTCAFFEKCLRGVT